MISISNTQSINFDLCKRLQALALAKLPNTMKKTRLQINCKLTQKIIESIAWLFQNTVLQLY